MLSMCTGKILVTWMPLGSKILAEVKVVDGVDGKEWVKCRRTIWKADNHLVCKTPAGAGRRNEIQVTIGDQTSEQSTEGFLITVFLLLRK